MFSSFVFLCFPAVNVSGRCPPSTDCFLLRREFHVIVTIMDVRGVFFIRRVEWG
jgi:hypothetical protein